MGTQTASLAVAKDPRQASIDRRAPRSVTRATPRDPRGTKSETLAGRRVSLPMFRGPLAPHRDSTILATCTRRLPNDSLGLTGELLGPAGDSLGLPGDLLGTPGDAQTSLCDLLALPIVSLITCQEVARYVDRFARYDERLARSADTNAPCSEKVARSWDRLSRCKGRVVRSTERLARYSERLSRHTEQLARILSAHRSLQLGRRSSHRE